MNKLTPQNEQQEHMVQILLAKMQGHDIEIQDCANEWSAVAACAIYLDANYRIKSHELPITKEMWAIIDKKWKYVALDEDGGVWFYENIPYFGTQNWDVGEGTSVENRVLNINTDGIDWRKSLTERPEEGVNEHITA